MSYEWSDEEPAQSKTKPKQQEDDYGDDFEDDDTQKRSSVKLPKLQKQKKADKTKSTKTKSGKKQRKETQNDYDNDFQPEETERSKHSPPNNKALSKSRNTASQNHSSVKKQPTNSSSKSPVIANKSSVQRGDSKYLHYLRAQFPHSKEEVSNFSSQKINRLNERLKKYISAVNDELTDMINENMRKLKSKQNKQNRFSEAKSVEDEIRILQEQKRSGNVHLEVMERDIDILNERFISLSEEQVETQVNEDLAEMRAYLKETSKEVYNLKKDMHDDGNRLMTDLALPEKIVEVKSNLIQTKKEDERQLEKMERQTHNAKDLQKKNAAVDAELSKLYSLCKQKNIKVTTAQEDEKLAKTIGELQKKVAALKSHIPSFSHLTDTKLGILKRDNEIIKAEMIEMEARQATIDQQLEFTQQNSKRLIEDSKRLNLQPHLQAHLEFILRNIEDGDGMNKSIGIGFSKSNKEQQKGNNSTVMKGLKKYSSVTNVHVNRSQSESEGKASFHIQKKNPLVLNKKDKRDNLLKISEKPAEKRIWRDSDKNNDDHKGKQEESRGQPTKIQASKKNESQGLSESQQKKQDSTPEAKSANPLGPKMMKFKKSNPPNESKASPSQQIEKENKESFKESNEKNNNQSNSKPKFRLKKAQKQIVDIPSKQLNVFTTEPNFEKKQNDNKVQEKLPEDEPIMGGRRQMRKLKKKEEETYAF